jgi:hypothetical protein
MMEQDSLDRTEGQDSQNRTARRLAGKYIQEKDGQNITARTGQLGQGSGDETTVAGQLGYGILNRITKTGQPEQVDLDGITCHICLDRSAWAEQRGQAKT